TPGGKLQGYPAKFGALPGSGHDAPADAPWTSRDAHMRTLSDLLTEIPRYQSGGDVDVVRRAYEFTEEVHRGQLRVSGEPYHVHPLAVAGLLVEFKMDATTVAAGLLHDVLEDTATSKDVLVERFGGDIAELVDGVTKIGKLAFASREERQAENFRKMLVAMAR